MNKRILIQVLRELCVRYASPGETFLLKSGKSSDVYVDLRAASLDTYALCLITTHLAAEINVSVTSGVDFVAGVELGGCPLATTLAMVLQRRCFSPVNALYVRKPKAHGLSKQIEGLYEPHKRVVLVEDVVTTGASTLAALEVLNASGLNVVGVLAVLDRCEGGSELISKQVPFRKLLTLSELIG